MSQSTGTASAPDVTADLELIGPIVRLQVQISSLKQGERPRSWYDPAPIRSVPKLQIDDGGVTGIDGTSLADVHHRDHPLSKYRGENGISVGLTGHYKRMRERFGDHLVEGIAGESILVQADRTITEGEIEHGVVILTANGPVELSAMLSAPPCVEFSKFCAGYRPEQKPDLTITETLQFLNDGMRGFYATLAEGSPSPAAIAVGDRVYRRRQ
jgi:hypothetical protein